MPSKENAAGYDADELGQYSSVSSLAVTAFVLGLCSAVNFAAPLLIVVPLAAVGAALLALSRIAASEGGLTGARLARLGIGLAVLFALGALTRVEVRDRMLLSQADRVGQRWLEMASQGRVDDMTTLMTKAAADKLRPDADTAPSGSVFGKMLASTLMRQDPIVVALSNLRGEGSLQYEIDVSETYATRKPAEVAIRYDLSNDSGDTSSCVVVLKRYRISATDQIWLIDSWQPE